MTILFLSLILSVSSMESRRYEKHTSTTWFPFFPRLRYHTEPRAQYYTYTYCQSVSFVALQFIVHVKQCCKLCVHLVGDVRFWHNNYVAIYTLQQWSMAVCSLAYCMKYKFPFRIKCYSKHLDHTYIHIYIYKTQRRSHKMINQR